MAHQPPYKPVARVEENLMPYEPATPPDPALRVHCWGATTCGWRGTVADCKAEPGSLVCCPRCGQPVEREDVVEGDLFGTQNQEKP